MVFGGPKKKQDKSLVYWGYFTVKCSKIFHKKTAAKSTINLRFTPLKMIS